MKPDQQKQADFAMKAYELSATKDRTGWAWKLKERWERGENLNSVQIAMAEAVVGKFRHKDVEF